MDDTGDRHSLRTRAAYFTPELERRQGDTEENLDEQFGALKGHRKELCFMAVGLVVSTIFYILNVVSDIVLALGYAHKQEYLKFGATISLVYFSSLVTTYISVIWYRMVVGQRDVVVSQLEPGDSEVRLPHAPHSLHASTLTSSNVCLRSLYIFLIFILQLAPIVSCIISLKIIWQHLRRDNSEVSRVRRLEQSGINSEDEPLREELHEELQVMGMIKLHGDYENVLQTFLQDVPQSSLQVSLLIIDIMAARGHFFSNFHAWWRAFSIVLSINGVRSATKSYTSSVTTFTFLVDGKRVRDPQGGVLGFIRALWHLLIPVGRASSLVYIVTHFSFTAGVTSVLLYWLLMLMWLKDDFRGWRRLENVVLHIARAWVFIWVAVSSKSPRSISFYCMYYFVLLVDASAVFTISTLFYFRVGQHVALTVTASLGLGLQLLGMVLKLIYYFNIRRTVTRESDIMRRKIYQPYNIQT